MRIFFARNNFADFGGSPHPIYGKNPKKVFSLGEILDKFNSPFKLAFNEDNFDIKEYFPVRMHFCMLGKLRILCNTFLYTTVRYKHTIKNYRWFQSYTTNIKSNNPFRIDHEDNDQDSNDEEDY